jgi:hypothetical protein
MRICDCAAPGLSTSTTCRAFTCGAAGRSARAPRGAADLQDPNALSTSGNTASGVTSPATRSAAFAGTTWLAWNDRRSSTLNPFSVTLVPSVPVP